MKCVIVVGALLCVLKPAAAGAETACADLASELLPDRAILSAEAVPAGRTEIFDGRLPQTGVERAYDLPAFCRVRVRATPSPQSDIMIEVWMPAAWNGRFYQHGAGGGGGRIGYAAMADLLRSGAAVAATNDGYARGAEDEPTIASPERLVDQWERALVLTTFTAKALIQRRYGRAPSFSYFEGCSGGGRYALLAAEEFADQWDGILAGAPANNATGFYLAHGWNSQTWPDPASWIPANLLPAIQRAALASCSRNAHVIGSIATDPRFCRTDLSHLACGPKVATDCLSNAQLATLMRIYGGPVGERSGTRMYPGYPPTSEQGWAGVIMPRGSTAPWSLIAEGFFRNQIYRDPAWSMARFDVDDAAAAIAGARVGDRSMQAILDANSADLSILQRRGGKILIYAGWSDPYLSPLESINYYQRAAERAGGQSAASRFLRLFMVPGMGHCFGGEGANGFGQYPGEYPGEPVVPALRNDPDHNILRALEAWVETGRPPERIIATKYVDDDPGKGVSFSRPLCPFPRVAIHDGRGPIASPESFRCVPGAQPDR